MNKLDNRRKQVNQSRRTSKEKGVFPPADHTHQGYENRITDIESGNADVTAVTANYTALDTDNIIQCTGTFTVTLYTAVQDDGMTIVNIGTGEITLGTETVNGVTDMILDANSSVTIFGSSKPDWRIR